MLGLCATVPISPSQCQRVSHPCGPLSIADRRRNWISPGLSGSRSHDCSDIGTDTWRAAIVLMRARQVERVIQKTRAVYHSISFRGELRGVRAILRALLTKP